MKYVVFNSPTLVELKVHFPLSLILSFGLTIAMISTVGLISSSISSVALYAIGDSSRVPSHTDDECYYSSDAHSFAHQCNSDRDCGFRPDV